MRKLIVASAFAALMASAPAMAASPSGSIGGGAARRYSKSWFGSSGRGWCCRCGRFDWLKKHQHAVHAHGPTRAFDKI